MADVQHHADTLRFGDGSSMELPRLAQVDDATWDQVKDYLQRNPEVAKGLKSLVGNTEAICGELQTQAIATHYNAKVADGDQEVQDRLNALKEDPELAPIFETIMNNGIDAALEYCQDEELMLKISSKMGGVPRELKSVLDNIELQVPQNGPSSQPSPTRKDPVISLHEASKQGNLEAVWHYTSTQPWKVNDKDARGITALGYAIGGQQIQVLNLLLQSRADACCIDKDRNTGLHYAAGYGRQEIVELLLCQPGAAVEQANAKGQTPFDVARINNQAAVLKILESHRQTSSSQA